MFENKRFWLLLIPFIIFIALGYFLWVGLDHDPRSIPSPLLNKSAPSFQQPSLQNAQEIMTEKMFLNQTTILNVFATWCSSCQAEHSVWMAARRDFPQIKFIGLNLKDDRHKVQAWLKNYGNPFDQIIFDQEGKMAIDYGVYGTPETFIIDNQGIIRYKFIGAISPTDWQETLLPELKKWQSTNI